MASRLPPGQTLTQKWPVLTYGDTPRIDLGTWTFRCFGAVEEEVSWTWAEFLRLPQSEVRSDIHCVTRWSRFDNVWRGVAVTEVLDRVRVRPEAVAVMAHAEQGYTTNIPLERAIEDDVLLVHTWEGKPLPPEHGGPCRMITPKLYAWKGTKWIRKIEFLAEDQKGFWEVRGYSNSAEPWFNDRYSTE